MARTTPKVHSGGQRGGTVYTSGAIGIGVGTGANATPQQQPNQTADDEEEDVIVSSISDDEAQEIQAEYDDIGWDSRTFRQLSDAEYDKIYSDNRASYKKNGNIINAKRMYESATSKPQSQTYGNQFSVSHSQDLNHRLNHGLPLDADSQFMHTYLSKALHPIGQDCTMVRAAHSTVIDNALQQVGIRSYQGLSESQLRTALVGTTMQMKSYGSWATNPSKNPFWGSGAQAGGREVEIIARTASTTKVFSGARKQSEIVTGVGQNMRITDVKVTNRTAYQQKGGSKPIIQVYVDMW